LKSFSQNQSSIRRPPIPSWTSRPLNLQPMLRSPTRLPRQSPTCHLLNPSRIRRGICPLTSPWNPWRRTVESDAPITDVVSDGDTENPSSCTSNADCQASQICDSQLWAPTRPAAYRPDLPGDLPAVQGHLRSVSLLRFQRDCPAGGHCLQPGTTAAPGRTAKRLAHVRQLHDVRLRRAHNRKLQRPGAVLFLLPGRRDDVDGELPLFNGLPIRCGLHRSSSIHLQTDCPRRGRLLCSGSLRLLLDVRVICYEKAIDGPNIVGTQHETPGNPEGFRCPLDLFSVSTATAEVPPCIAAIIGAGQSQIVRQAVPAQQLCRPTIN